MIPHCGYRERRCSAAFRPDIPGNARNTTVGTVFNVCAKKLFLILINFNQRKDILLCTVIPDIFRTVLAFLFLVGQYSNTIHDIPPFPFIAIFKNSAYRNGIFAVCSLQMLLAQSNYHGSLHWPPSIELYASSIGR